MGQPEKPYQGTDREYIAKKHFDMIKYLRIILIHMPKLDRETLGKMMLDLVWKNCSLISRIDTYKNLDKRILTVRNIINNHSLLKDMLKAGVESCDQRVIGTHCKLKPIITYDRYSKTIPYTQALDILLGDWLNKLVSEAGQNPSAKLS